MQEGLISATVSIYLIAASGMIAAQTREVTSNPRNTLYVQYQNSKDPAQELGAPQDVNYLDSLSSPFRADRSRPDTQFYSIREVPGFEEFQALPPWVGDVGYDCDPALDCSLGPNALFPIEIIERQQRR